MDRDGSISRRWMVLVGGVALGFWGVSGYLLGRGVGETGFFYGPDYQVRTVMEGSTAEAAGIRVGDRMVSVDGVPVEELPMQSRWRERPVGATATVAVQREGETLSLPLPFGAVPPERQVRALRELVVNLAFLGLGLWGYLSVGTPLALILGGIGLARAAAGFPGPHLGPRFEGIGASVQMVGIVAFSLLLLRFFLEVPRPRKIVRSGTAQRLMWGGTAAAALTCVVEVTVHPAWYMISGYILLALIAPVYLLLFGMVPWSWFKASEAERRTSGFGLVMFGYLVGLGPVVLRLLVETILGVTVPGGEWIPMVEVAVPLFLALGVRRHAASFTREPVFAQPATALS